MTLPRPGHADLAGVLKYGHEDVRNALERASARHTAVYVAAGAVAKALLRELGIEVAGTVVEIGGETRGLGGRDRRGPRRPRHARRRRRGARDGRAAGARLVRATEDRLDARLAAALMGIQAVKGVEIGDGFALARERGSAAHDEIEPGLAAALEPRRRHRGRRLERRGDRRPRRR